MPMILLVGAGAVGTIFATLLAAGGRPLSLYARPKDVPVFSAIDRLQLDPATPGDPVVTAPRPVLHTDLSDLAGFDTVVIAVKYPDLDAVIASLPATIPAGCTVVSMLNGVDSVRRLRARFPSADVVQLSTMFNGQLAGPLHARLATSAQIVLGTRDTALADRFRVPGLVVKTTDGEAAAWGKLYVNFSNAICALTHSTFKDLFTDRDLRRVYVATMDEATGALRAAGIRVELPLAVPLPLYRFLLLHGGPVPWWFAHYSNGIREGAYPSMVNDVAAGRTTEIEQINGEIVRVGRETGFPTPVNERLVAAVKAMAVPPGYRSFLQLREMVGL